ncbi:hypothetical protein [Microbacterium aquilitoris]|uniref:hypothetical protein n=1 Tax=Microbacterium aquilitoris TaxID=3067307 RepID=UPI00289073F0|nr:hypothetical protein [Microbacterium sp. KSW2-22]MDT3343878.1 hypothetical protein [Microbacterium sp. KSW2-22]
MLWPVIVLYLLAAILPSVGLVLAYRRAKISLATYDPNDVYAGMVSKANIEVRGLIGNVRAASRDLSLVLGGLASGATASIWSLFL